MKKEEPSNIGWYIFIGLALVLSMTFLPLLVHAEDVDLDKISMIESCNEPTAVNGAHVGMFQISQGVVSMYNNRKEPGWYWEKFGSYKLNLNDMYDPDDSYKVADWYLNEQIPKYLMAYNIPDTITSRIIAWNWGIGHLRKWFRNGSQWSKLPRETRNYIKKYEGE